MIEQTLISRLDLAARLGVKPGTIAKWERTWFPRPRHRISDRLVMYSADEVDAALRNRAERARPLRRLPRTA